VILQAAIVTGSLKWPTPGLALLALSALVGATVLLQHRTIWLAGLVVAIAAFAAWAGRQERDGPGVYLATGAVCILIPVAIWGFAQSDSLVQSTRDAASENSTLVWRTSGWQQLIASHDSAVQISAGDPAGADRSRLIGHRSVAVTPHNEFVDGYLRFGLPGVLIILSLWSILWVRRRELAPQIGLTPTVVALILATQAVFSFAYSLDVLQGMILGGFLSGLAAANATAPSRSPYPAMRPGYASR
jgi:hypothetical protein